jgi:hypothetical protein
MESNPTDQELYPIRAAGVVSRQPQPAADGPAAGALAAGRSASCNKARMARHECFTRMQSCDVVRVRGHSCHFGGGGDRPFSDFPLMESWITGRVVLADDQAGSARQTTKKQE